MALQPPPPQLRQLLGSAYTWLTKFIHDVGIVQTQSNTALYVSGLTLQNNTPSGGKITWSACTVFYQGVAYLIPAGSTPNSELFVTWTVGASAFTVGNTYTPGPTVFPILTNNQGTADVTWDKVGANSVQAAHLFPVLTYDGPNGSLIISNVIFSDNTPGAGSVQWSACQATYQGVTYSIPSGSATSPNLAIIWRLSSPTQFQAVAFPLTLGTDDFVLGFNSPSGSPAVNGFFNRVFRLADRTGAWTLIDETGIQGNNKNNNPTFACHRGGADAAVGAAGGIQVFDGTGSGSQTQVSLKGAIANGGGAVAGVVYTRPSTFAQLPTPAVQGDTAMITDGAAFSYGAIAAGGGTVVQKVFFDGTNWRQG